MGLYLNLFSLYLELPIDIRTANTFNKTAIKQKRSTAQVDVLWSHISNTEHSGGAVPR